MGTNHERADGAGDRTVAASRGRPPRPHAATRLETMLLNLQRQAGNKAVAQLMESRRDGPVAVQRADDPPGDTSQVAPPPQPPGGTRAAPPPPGTAQAVLPPRPPGATQGAPTPPGALITPGARTTATGTKEDWGEVYDKMNVHQQNCSWVTLAAVLATSEKKLTKQWQTAHNVETPRSGLRTEAAWAAAMVGFERLKTVNSPNTFKSAVDGLVRDLRGIPGAMDVAQSYGVMKMIVDAIDVASAGRGAGPQEAAYALGDSGRDKFEAPDVIVAAMRRFPDGTTFAVFLHGSAQPGGTDGGHYVFARNQAGILEFVDHQEKHGGGGQRGPMTPQNGWPVLHADFQPIYTEWKNGAFVAKSPAALDSSPPGLRPVTAATVESYFHSQVATVLPKPAWAASVTIGTTLLRHSTSAGLGKGLCTVTGPLAFKNGWSLPVRSDLGAWSGVTLVPVSDLGLPSDVGKVTHAPPAWYGNLVNSVASGIAADLRKSTGQLVNKAHNFTGPGGHIYNDGVIVAMGSGLRQMMRALGLTQGGVIVPEVDKTMFAVAQDRFAYMQFLDTPPLKMEEVRMSVKDKKMTNKLARRMRIGRLANIAVREYVKLNTTTAHDPIPPPATAPTASAEGAEAGSLIPSRLKRVASVEKVYLPTTRQDAIAAILASYGLQPARTSKGQVFVNLGAMTNLGQTAAEDVNAFVHLIIHEFVHANSSGGGGHALAGHGVLNQKHEEGVTDSIARAISEAINRARVTDAAGAPDVSSTVRDAVTEIKANTFGPSGGVRYQSEVDFVIAKITDLKTLREAVAKPYFTGKDKDAALEVLG